MASSGDIFKEIRLLVQAFQPADPELVKKIQAREAMLTKPAGSLGRLEDIALWYHSFRRCYPASFEKPVTIVFAGNHGIARQNVSAFPADVTFQMVENFRTGGAAINQLCRANGSRLDVVDLWLDRPTADFSEKSAMTAEKCLEAIMRGYNSVEPDSDLLCLGEMGIANTSSAAALCHAFFGGGAQEWTGPGTGIDGERQKHKAALIDKAVRRIEGVTDPLMILTELGGHELAGIVGAVIAAREKNIPTLLDGYVCSAAASVIHVMNPEQGLGHCLIGPLSAEPGHKMLAEKLSLTPLLSLDMRLGEASGAALAIAIVRAAVFCHNGMARFDDAGVSEKNIS